MFFLKLTFNLLLIFSLNCTAFCQSAKRVNEKYYEEQYKKILRSEREKRDKRRMVETGIAGGVAFLVGTYGFFTEKTGAASRLIYSLSQSAGIGIAGAAYMNYHSPSLLLLIDKELQRNDTLDDARFEKLVVLLEEKERLSESKAVAVTSTIIALLNGYNGYRERKSSPTLSGTLYFFSFNFSLLAGYSYYQWFSAGKRSLISEEEFDIAFVPFPTITVRF